MGSHNALIAFADGSYLELIAFKHRSSAPHIKIAKQVRAEELRAEPISPAERHMRSWETVGEGLVDFALGRLRTRLPGRPAAGSIWKVLCPAADYDRTASKCRGSSVSPMPSISPFSVRM
jgi:hypothetical protein